MKSQRIVVLSILMTLLLVVISVSAVGQWTVPDNAKPSNPGGGGRPVPTFITVEGTLSQYGEGYGFLYDIGNGEKQYVIDFGPEWYVPNDCLSGLLPSGTDTYTLQNGRYTIPLTCAARNPDGTCSQVSAPASNLGPNAGATLNLATPRPGDGRWIKAWGMTESKEGYVLVRVWEMQYDHGANPWTWWRWDGQPWQKTRLLSCDPAGEGE